MNPALHLVERDPPPDRPCPACGGLLEPHDPAHFRRYYKCRKCGSLVWHDGPPLLAPLDPQRKRQFTDRLIALTEGEAAWLKSL